MTNEEKQQHQRRVDARRKSMMLIRRLRDEQFRNGDQRKEFIQIITQLALSSDAEARKVIKQIGDFMSNYQWPIRRIGEETKFNQLINRLHHLLEKEEMSEIAKYTPILSEEKRKAFLENKRLDEAFNVQNIERFLRRTAIILQRYSGKQFTYVAKEKFRKVKDKEYLGITYSVGTTLLVRFNFTSQSVDQVAEVDLWLAYGSKPPITIDCRNTPFVTKLKEIGSIIRKGSVTPADTKQVTIYRKGKEVPILSPEEVEFKADMEEYKVMENDLEGRVQLFKDAIKVLVTSDDIHGVIATGTPGIGKSYTVLDVLESSAQNGGFDMKRNQDFIYLKGGKITSPQFFGYLRKYPDKLLVIDDAADTLLKDVDVMGMLKGALEPGSADRMAMYSTGRSSDDDDEGKIIDPYRGKLIFISNLAMKDLKYIDPVIDRVFHVHFDVDKKTVMDFIYKMLANIVPSATMEVKEEAFDFFKKYHSEFNSVKLKGVSVRAFTKVVALLQGGTKNWKQLALNIA